MCTGSIRINDAVMALENDPEGFLKLGAVLKPSPYSAEELRDEYISEKCKHPTPF